MTARHTDPSSSHERVEKIDTGHDRINGSDIRRAILAAFGSQGREHDDHIWVTDDDITAAYHLLTGDTSKTRNDIARHRLRWEERPDTKPLGTIPHPLIVRFPHNDGVPPWGKVIHFRLGRPGDLCRTSTRTHDARRWLDLPGIVFCVWHQDVHTPNPTRRFDGDQQGCQPEQWRPLRVHAEDGETP